MLQEVAASLSQGWLVNTQVLLVDLHLSQAYSSRRSSSNDIPWGLDDLFNLLHQQLGFKGAFQHMLSDDIIQLGWVRGISQHTARLQSPDTESSAAALQTASVGTPQIVHRHAICDCCSSSSGRCSRDLNNSSSSSKWLLPCPLWQRAVGRLLRTLLSPTACHILSSRPALNFSSTTAAADDSSDGGSTWMHHTQHEEGFRSTSVLPLLGFLNSLWHSAVSRSACTTSSGPAATCMASNSSWGQLVTCLAVTAAAIICVVVFRRLCGSAHWEVWASKCTKLAAAQSF